MSDTYPGCNFSSTIIQVYFAINGTNHGVPVRIQVYIEVDGGQSHDWITTPGNFNASKLSKAFFDLVINPSATAKLNASLRQQLADFLQRRPYSALLEHSFSSEKPGIFLTRTGWQRLPSGTVIFAAGSEIIGDPLEDILLEQPASSISLPLTMEPIRNAPQKLLAILLLEPVAYPAVWTFSLTTSMLSFLSQADVHFQAVEYLIGPYGTGKSTIVERLFAIYDQAEKPGQTALMYDAGSTAPALRESLATFQDIPIVLDDFCTSGDQETVRLRRRTTAKILRIAANKTTQTKGTGTTHENLNTVAGLAVTAELGLDSESEWSRFFPVSLKHGMKPLPPETRNLAADVLRHFLFWVAPQYDSLQGEFRREYQKIFETIMAKHPRTSTALFVLTWIAHLFCRFCQNQCSLTEQTAEELCDVFCSAIQASVRFQLQQTKLLAAQTPKETIPQLLVRGIEDGSLPLCTKVKHLSAHAGLKSNGKVYLWPNAVLQLISSQNGYQNYTKLKISKELKNSGILFQEYDGAEDNTVHLEVNGKRSRFLCLDQNALYNAADKSFLT